jgi:hypothetical protein
MLEAENRVRILLGELKAAHVVGNGDRRDTLLKSGTV